MACDLSMCPLTFDTETSSYNIFDCYWNGRLIPQTRVKQLPFCSEPKQNGTRNSGKAKIDDLNSLTRLSGTLFFGKLPLFLGAHQQPFARAAGPSLLRHPNLR